jgi:hypothetical protein
VGREIALRGYGPLVQGSKRVEGVLLAVEGGPGGEQLRVALDDGTETTVALEAVAKANLVFDWDKYDFGRASG